MENNKNFAEAFKQWEDDYNPLFKQAIAAEKASGKESSQVAELLDYIKEMQGMISESTKHIETMESQIAEMREIQKHPVKNVLTNIHENLNSCFEKAKEGLKNLMNKLVEGCKKIVESVKDTGIIAGDNIAKALDLKGIVETDKAVFETIGKLCDKAVKNCETFFAEAAQIGGHVKNMGRSLIGKEAVEVGEKQPGLISELFTAPYKAISDGCKAVVALDEKHLANLENQEMKAEAVKDFRAVVKTEKTIVQSAEQSEKSGVITQEAAAEIRNNSVKRVKQAAGRKQSLSERLNEKKAQAKKLNAERVREKEKTKAVPEVG
jgi:hypothetical protein